MKNTYVHVAKVHNNHHKSDHISGPTRFSEGEILHKGESRVTLGGNEMESEVMEDDAPIGQTTKWKVAWE
jgi:hypothetical protein